MTVNVLKHVCGTTLLALFGGVLPAVAWAQCEYDWLAGPGQALSGVNGAVRDSVIWDPDGAGPEPELFVVGGHFTAVGDVVASRLAGWDGVAWRSLGDESVLRIERLVVHDGDLVAVGQFTDGPSNTPIRRFDGTSWEPLAQTSMRVTALAVHNGELFAAGDGRTQDRIVRWDGAAWQTVLPAGAVQVRAMASFGGDLIVGGFFSAVGGVEASNIARWDGATWHALGSGSSSSVNDLVEFNGQLIAAGQFTAAGATYIASWDGNAWGALGAGLPGPVSSLAVSEEGTGTLYAAASIPGADTNHRYNVARWDGSGWSFLGTGMNGSVDLLQVHAGAPIAAGIFTMADDRPMSGPARWDGATWTVMQDDPGLDDGVWAFASFAGDLIAGGYFTRAGSVQGHLARFDGAAWQPVGGGVDGEVTALRVYNGELVAAGRFTTTGDGPAGHIARWDGTAWRRFGPGVGYGVSALAVYDGELIAGGAMSEAGGYPVNGIAAWDGEVWYSLGGGVRRSDGYSGSVYALALYEGDLVIGGSFVSAGTQQALSVARWNGQEWRPMGNGAGEHVYALAVYNGDLYAGGRLTDAIGDPEIARWDGAAWIPVPGGGSDIQALTVYDGELIVTGSVQNRIVAWNGSSWRPLGTGLDGGAGALWVHEGELIAGGVFSRAGDVVSAGWARWGPVTPPLCPADLNCDQIVDPADVVTYVNLWFAGDPRAERTEAPQIDVFDLLSYLNEWFTGC